MKETQKSVTAITAINSKRLCKNVVFLSEKENVCRQLFSLLDQNNNLAMCLCMRMIN